MKKITTTLSIGIDLVKLSRFEKIINGKGRGLSSDFVTRFSGRILNPIHETPVFMSVVESGNTTEAVRYLAGNWAMKEAIYKTLDEESQKKFQFNQWFKLYDERGKPNIAAEEYNKNEEFLLSISHEEEFLVATVLRQAVDYYVDRSEAESDN